MDTLPLFLNLIKSHALLYAFLTTGNMEAILQNYEGHGFYASEKSIILCDFNLDNSEAFEYIQITQFDSATVTILFVPYTNKYFIDRGFYFGEKTIYYNYLDKIKGQGIALKNPYRYCFPFLGKQGAISLIDESMVSIVYGDNVCRVF